MRSYILYKDKSVKGFKRLANAGNGVFGKYRSMASSFIRYAGSDLDKKLSQYDSILDLNSISLETVFPTKYRWLISNISLKNSWEYLNSLEDRITEFNSDDLKENLKILVGVLFMKFVLITKVVETYLEAAATLKSAGQDISSLDLASIGIGKQVLKYFDDFEVLGTKSIDDWLKYKSDPATARYFSSSMKRILSIMLGEDSTF